jgi:hypothetical protein
VLTIAQKGMFATLTQPASTYKLLTLVSATKAFKGTDACVPVWKKFYYSVHICQN